MLARARQTATMLWYVHPSQLAHRLRLVGKRRWDARHAAQQHRVLRARVHSPTLALNTAPAILPIRGPEVHVHANELVLNTLGTTRTLPFPIDWTTDADVPAQQAWRMELHQHLYLNQLSASHIETLVQSWIGHNPPFRRHAWKDAWNSNVVSIRVMSWLDVLTRRTNLPHSLRKRMCHSLVEQLLYLEAHLERDIGGNHILRNANALLWAASMLVSPHGARWQQLGERLFSEQLDVQFLADGVHYERSGFYHLLAATDVVRCWHRLVPGPLKRSTKPRVHAILQALVDLTHPDGRMMSFNDGCSRQPIRTSELLASWKDLGGDTITPRPVFDLPNSGYTGFRGERDYVLFDSGRIAPDCLPGHGHGDCLAFEWSVDNQRVFVDTGVFEYTAGARRQRSRATAAHNTVTVANADQCEFFDAFRVARRLRVADRVVHLQSNAFHATASHNGYRHLRRSPIHHRTFQARDGHIAIRDHVSGGSGQPVTARLLLHPDATIVVRGHTAHIRLHDLHIRIRASADIRVQQAPYYPDFGVEQVTRQLVIDYGPAPAHGWLDVQRHDRIALPCEGSRD